ncbi:hypothetical protein M422DRAFT_69504 [Sphaerobolus stellatus SS14]|uniref:MFS general substrate transporter n=1 Tax=Sphaerobolus stellatus (strain SS14) TaxID=990650 RepID=A0A0C9UQS3_SPHS4|nr:hypothetical protein M422DRAFT_69504 [Sphaerobolus stellatus SS14]
MTGFSALPIGGDEEALRNMQWSGESKVLGPRWLRMPLLTVGMMGLQIIWSVEMSYASPYLISMGLSRSFMSIVFLAGPLSGLIVQPLVGGLSDRSHSRFGRRRPYIFMGILTSFAAMYLFGFTRAFSGIITTSGSAANHALTVALAVLSIYLIDFSINAVQAMDRALLVDILPISEQERGNAWAGRMFGVGSVFGFFVGNIDLTGIFPFLGNSQIKILCVVSSLLLLGTHFITIFNVKERVLRKSNDSSLPKLSVFGIVKDIWASFFKLPKNIKQICYIQLFAWIGWFPVLFWTTLYVGGIYERNSPIPETDEDAMAMEAEATRLGSRALLCNALASLIISVIGPFFVTGTRSGAAYEEGFQSEKGTLKRKLYRLWKGRPTIDLAMLWAISHGLFSVCMLSTFFIDSVIGATLILTVAGFCWAITTWAPFALIAEEIHSSSGAHHYALSDRDDVSDVEEAIPLRDRRTNRPSGEEPLGNEDEGSNVVFEYKEDDIDPPRRSNGSSKHVHFAESDNESRTSKELDPPSAALGLNSAAQQSMSDINQDHGDDEVGTGTRHAGGAGERSIEDMAGIILGIHNVFIVIPQFIITGLSSIIFAIMDPARSVLDSDGHHPALPGGVPGVSANGTVANAMADGLQPRAEGEVTMRNVDSVAVIFRIGGLSAAVACVLAVRLGRELKRARR